MRSRYARCAASKSTIASPPNFSLRRPRQLPRDRRLGDDGERLDRRDVAALDERLRRLAGREVDGVERPHQRRQRLHRRRERRSPRRSRRRPRSRRRGSSGASRPGSISSCAAEPRSRASAKPSPISTPFTAWMPISAAGEARVEPVLARRVGAEARADAARAHLDDAAERVRGRARAASIACLPALALAADLEHRPGDADPELAQQRLRDRRRRRRRRPCAARSRARARCGRRRGRT